MVDYRRNYIKGGTYFFTLTLASRQSQLLLKHIDLLRSAMKQVKNENSYKTKAIVVLPDHIHVIWELPDGDDNYSMRWRKIKRYFTIGLIKTGLPLLKNRHGEYNVWQRRFWEHTVKNDRDFEVHVNYIHYNPVKHGYVKRVIDWPFSSFHGYVKRNILTKDWAGGGDGLLGRQDGE